MLHLKRCSILSVIRRIFSVHTMMSYSKLLNCQHSQLFLLLLLLHLCTVLRFFFRLRFHRIGSTSRQHQPQQWLTSVTFDLSCSHDALVVRLLWWPTPTAAASDAASDATINASATWICSSNGNISWHTSTNVELTHVGSTSHDDDTSTTDDASDHLLPSGVWTSTSSSCSDSHCGSSHSSCYASSGSTSKSWHSTCQISFQECQAQIQAPRSKEEALQKGISQQISTSSRSSTNQ